MDKRYVLALVLMSVVMVIWFVVQSKVTPPPARNQQVSESPVREPENDEIGKEEVVSEGDSNEFRLPITEGPKASVKTNYYEAEIALDTAAISSWKLNKYKRRDKENGDVVDLIPPKPSANNYLAIELISRDEEKNWLRNEVKNWRPVGKTSITLGAESEQEQDSIIFKGDIEEPPISVTKKYTFYRDSYIVDVDITFENLSSERQVFNGYKLNWGAGISADKEHPDRYSGAIVYFLGDKKAKRDLKEQVASGEQPVWAGLSNKYFSAVIIPDPSIKAQYDRHTLLNAKSKVPYVAKPADIVKLVISQFVLEADESRVHSFRLYVGPKDTKELKGVQVPQTGEHANLELLVNFGLFGWLSKMMLWMLNAINSFIGNYGVSIIIVTTLLKALLYPLTMKSHKSMSKMQQLKEPLAELKEKYRDNPQELNKKTMALYKRHGVNPLSGCIIWLPQMPIFWAFYSVLRSAIEVREAPFFLWISDLSLPDTLVAIPIAMPFFPNGIPIRVLPILMSVAMFLQQRMTGATMGDPKQSKMMNYMSIFFMIIFYGFPSGLVLYWLWNNILTIGQQYFLAKRMAAEPIIEEDANVKKKKKGGKKRK